MSDDASDDAGSSRDEKAADAFRTISEVAEDLELPQHVLRFWETRFTQIKPLKRGGGRRYYRPQDVELLRGIRHLLYGQGYTIRGVQRILRERGLRFVVSAGQGTLSEPLPQPHPDDLGVEVDAPAPAVRKVPARVAEVPPVDDEDDGAAESARRFAGPQVQTVLPQSASSLNPVLAPDEVRRLEATLSDLLECKRLLDQAR